MPTCSDSLAVAPAVARIRNLVLHRVLPVWFTLGLAASGQAQADATALHAVTVNSYPVPLLDVDGQSKYVAVVSSRGVEIRRCQHMVVTSLNYLACELNDGARSYNVVIPIVREAVDIREPWSYFAPGVYR
jgi:hypothetical protein